MLAGTRSPSACASRFLALDRTELSPRELACHFTDDERYFVSESSVYRILKSHDLITSPAYVLLSASDRFKNPTRRVHELWQTDFTYFRIVGWGWAPAFHLASRPSSTTIRATSSPERSRQPWAREMCRTRSTKRSL